MYSHPLLSLGSENPYSGPWGLPKHQECIAKAHRKLAEGFRTIIPMIVYARGHTIESCIELRWCYKVRS